VAASGLGLYLGLIYEWRRTLVTPICLHIIQNGLAAATALVIVFQNAGAPILGIQGEPVSEGLRVTVVFEETGAAKAGIHPGDVITVIEEWSVHNLRDVKWVMRQRQAGDRVRVELLRNGEPLTVLVELTPAPTRARTERESRSSP
jgi:S1-C subfamily serine protease